MDTSTSSSVSVPNQSTVPAPNPVASVPAPQKGGRGSLIVLSVVLVLALGYGLFAYFSEVWPFGSGVVVNPTVSPGTSAQPTITPLPAGVKTFTSSALGISFEYLASQGDPVIEKGSTVYVGGLDGQSVEMFTKDPADDLKTAIRKRFLAGISEKDCPVVVEQNGTVSTGAIDVGFEMTGWDDARWDASPCPVDYRVTNGIQYFWMDADHPDRFFFFSIGQYAIPARPDGAGGGDLTWQDTFTVLD